MKTYLLFISIVFMCFNSIAQKKEFENPIYTDPQKVENSTNENFIEFHNFNIEDYSVQYKKIFDLPETSENEIINNLNSYLPTISNLTYLQFNGNVFTGKIEGLFINYKKFGAKWAKTWLALNHPMYGNLTIQVKDNKYRVIITEMEFFTTNVNLIYKVNNTINTNNNTTEFSKNKTIQQGLELMDLFFTEKFTFNKDKITEDW